MPVGSKEALKAAIMGGADAVYLGGKLFGARRLAENFTDAELGHGVNWRTRTESKSMSQ
jgi:putative protease